MIYKMKNNRGWHGGVTIKSVLNLFTLPRNPLFIYEIDTEVKCL
jgi:hypothetical protein